MIDPVHTRIQVARVEISEVRVSREHKTDQRLLSILSRSKSASSPCRARSSSTPTEKVHDGDSGSDVGSLVITVGRNPGEKGGVVAHRFIAMALVLHITRRPKTPTEIQSQSQSLHIDIVVRPRRAGREGLLSGSSSFGLDSEPAVGRAV